MSKIEKPCAGCTQLLCDYRRCDPYRAWVKASWQEFRRFARHNYWSSREPFEDRFAYIHPDLVRRYLDAGPCGRCDCAANCNVPCADYLNWWDARMVWLRWQVQQRCAGQTQKDQREAA